MRVKIQALSKGFAGSSILKIASYSVESGDQVVIMGESGCGKTTFLHVLAGLYEADSGSIQLNDTDLTALSSHQKDAFRGRHLGYIFQSFNLLPEINVLENLKLALRFGSGKADETQLLRWLERVGMGDEWRRHPAQLSIGQRQRVAVVRAMVNNPGLVLADEPTGSLDEGNKEKVLQLIRELCREGKRTLILVTHDPVVASHFERVDRFEEMNAVKP